ncbi:MAG: hypothetical protein QXP66_00660 [Candidatus Aenigmatarchaeota archaeon]
MDQHALTLAELRLQKERVMLGIKEQEFAIMQRESEIARLRESIKVSEARIKEIDSVIDSMNRGAE